MRGEARRCEANDGGERGFHFADRSFACSVLGRTSLWLPPSSSNRVVIMQTCTRVAFVHRNAITFMDILHFAISPCGVPVADTESTGYVGVASRNACRLQSLIACSLPPGSLVP